MAGCRALAALGLIVVTTAGKSGAANAAATVGSLSARFDKARSRADVQKLAEWCCLTVEQVLILIWAVNFAAAQPGQPLPRLEDIDNNLAFIPPEGVDYPSSDFDARAVLMEAEVELEIDVPSGPRRP